MTSTINHSYNGRHHTGAMEHNADPDPEVLERAKGPRRFPAAYKAEILAEYESLPRAAKGALLRWRVASLGSRPAPRAENH